MTFLFIILLDVLVVEVLNLGSKEEEQLISLIKALGSMLLKFVIPFTARDNFFHKFLMGLGRNYKCFATFPLMLGASHKTSPMFRSRET
jgi:hypothetical protein